MLSLTADARSAVPPARPDPVELARLESFPASDPLGWIGATRGTPHRVAKYGKILAFRTRRAPRAPALGAVPDATPASVPNPALGLPVRIYRPSLSPLQSGLARSAWVIEFEPQQATGIDPLMGWTTSRDPLQQIRLTFPSREQAIAFSRRQGWRYTVSEPHERKLRPRLHAENLQRPWVAAEEGLVAGS